MATIDQAPEYFRTSISRAGELKVFRDEGIYEAGLIKDVSVISRGPALGHDLWIDYDFLSDTAAEVNRATMASNTGGIKARFTHPSLSSDGIGTKLGRIRNARVDGDRVIADLHFQKASHQTPDGNLASYVMTLAEETPDDFGLSIVFEHDVDSERRHHEANTFSERYISPDEENKNNYSHAILASLRAVDVVDSPAANKGGLFTQGQEYAKEAEETLSYALGLSDVRPSVSMFDVHPDRLRLFVSRFLGRQNITIQEGGDPVTEKTEDVAAEKSDLTRDDFAAELDRFIQRFGSENGGQWFVNELSYETAMESHCEIIEAENLSLKEKLLELEDTIQSLDRGEDDGLDFQEDTEVPAKKRDLSGRINILGR